MARRAGRVETNGPVGRLQALGFSEYEARAYIALLGVCPATGYEISKAAGVPRANTYAALESLTKKSAVQPISENPARYMPLAPDVLLGRIAEDTSARCTALARDLAVAEREEAGQFVWTIAGERNVHAKIAEMIGRARDHVWIKADEESLDTQRDALAAAGRRGVEVLIILFGGSPERYRFGRKGTVYLHEANGMRIGFSDNLFTLAIDFVEALTASVRGDVYGAYTRNEAVVRMAETLIRHDVYLAEIFEHFGPEIDARFGPHLLSLRRRHFSPDQLEALERTITALAPEHAIGPQTSARGRSRP